MNKFYEHPDGYMTGITADSRVFYFDKEDYETFKQHSWSINGDGYVCTCINYKTVKLHKLLLNKDIVSFKNKNKLDCRKENLVESDKQKLSRGTRKTKKKCTSKYKGVSKKGDRWAACIYINSKNKHLGYFDDEKEAARTYNWKAQEIFGEDCYLNVI